MTQQLTVDEHGNIVWRDELPHRFPLPFDLGDKILATDKAADEQLRGRQGDVIGIRPAPEGYTYSSVPDQIVSVQWHEYEANAYYGKELANWAWIVDRELTSGEEPALGGSRSQWPIPLLSGQDGWLEQAYEQVELWVTEARQNSAVNHLTMRQIADERIRRRLAVWREHVANQQPPEPINDAGRRNLAGTMFPERQLRWEALTGRTAVVMNAAEAERRATRPDRDGDSFVRTAFGNIIASPHVPPGHVYLLTTPDPPARGGYTPRAGLSRLQFGMETADGWRALGSIGAGVMGEHTQGGFLVPPEAADDVRRLIDNPQSVRTIPRHRITFTWGRQDGDEEEYRALRDAIERSSITHASVELPDAAAFDRADALDATAISRRWMEANATRAGVAYTCPECGSRQGFSGEKITNGYEVRVAYLTCHQCGHSFAFLNRPQNFEYTISVQPQVEEYTRQASYIAELDAWYMREQGGIERHYRNSNPNQTPDERRRMDELLRAAHRRYTGALERARVHFTRRQDNE